MNYCYTLNYEKYLHIQTCIKQTNISGYYKFIFWNLFYENVNVVSRSRILMVILCLYLWWILIVDVNGWICTVFYVQYCVLCKEMLNEQSLSIFYYYLPCINYLLFDIFLLWNSFRWHCFMFNKTLKSVSYLVFIPF